MVSISNSNACIFQFKCHPSTTRAKNTDDLSLTSAAFNEVIDLAIISQMKYNSQQQCRLMLIRQQEVKRKPGETQEGHSEKTCSLDSVGIHVVKIYLKLRHMGFTLLPLFQIPIVHHGGLLHCIPTALPSQRCRR